MTITRDPKKHPQVGDVLRRFGCTRHVTHVAKKASGTLISVFFDDGAGCNRGETLIGSWRNWANADCEVLLRDDTTGDDAAPQMFIATHPRCGGLVASNWDDAGHEAENQQSCHDWHAKGYQVAKISVPEGTPMMSWCHCDVRGTQP